MLQGADTDVRMVCIMSAKDSIHYPHHVNIDEFVKDYDDKTMSATEMQKKYEISPRQYRLVARYMRETYRKKFQYHKSPKKKYIYRDTRGYYVVRKRIGTVFKYFGAYDTLDKAIKIRDMLIEYDWDKDMMGEKA